jgi:hypothetical protein
MVGSLALLHLTRNQSGPNQGTKFDVVFKDYACMFGPFLANTGKALVLFADKLEDVLKNALPADERVALEGKLVDTRSLIATVEAIIPLHNAFHLQVGPSLDGVFMLVVSAKQKPPPNMTQAHSIECRHVQSPLHVADIGVMALVAVLVALCVPNSVAGTCRPSRW